MGALIELRKDTFDWMIGKYSKAYVYISDDSNTNIYLLRIFLIFFPLPCRTAPAALHIGAQPAFVPHGFCSGRSCNQQELYHRSYPQSKGR